MLPTSPTPYPSTRTRPDGTVQVVVLGRDGAPPVETIERVQAALTDSKARMMNDRIEAIPAQAVDYAISLEVDVLASRVPDLVRQIARDRCLAFAVNLSRRLGGDIVPAQIKTALHMLRPASPNWAVPVLTLSALKKQGIADFWNAVMDYRRTLTDSGELAAKRRHQAMAWMWELIDSELRSRFRNHPQVKQELPALARAVEEGSTTPSIAALRLLGHL